MNRGSKLSMVFRRLAVVAVAPVLALALHAAQVPLFAQDATPRVPDILPRPAIAPLPSPVTTSHEVELPDRKLAFRATAGAIAIAAADRTVLADVAYTSYVLDGVAPSMRPVVFAYNGGPGSASTWLHIGAMGPWRVPLTAEVIAGRTPAEPIPNAESWLDFADLVFIDPPGTGHSRIWPSHQAAGAGGTYAQLVLPRPRAPGRRIGRPLVPGSDRNEGGPGWFWSLEGDIATFVEVIAAWLERNGRAGSPVVLVGESYGGFRTPLIAKGLHDTHAIRVAAMVLVSPVLDFDGRRGWRTPAHHIALLPSLAATHIERGGGVPTREALAEAETYSSGDYLLDLMRGPRDLAAVQRMTDRVTNLAGLHAEVVRQHSGRVSIGAFLEAGKARLPDVAAVSIYDAGMAGLAPVHGGRRRGYSDPFITGLGSPLTAAMASLHQRVSWQTKRPYAMMSGEVNRRWIWPGQPSPPQVLQTLHELHSRDARLRTLVTHGFTDLVTPYFASALQLDQLPAHGPVQRISLEVYPGGHMFYSRDRSRQQFRQNSLGLIGEATAAVADKRDRQGRETP